MTKESSSLRTANSSPMPPARWLITGGCGFIGLNLVKNLVEEGGHYIRIIDNLSVGTSKDLAQVCKFKKLDPKTPIPHSITESSIISPQHSSNFSVSSHQLTVVELIVADILDAEIAIKSAEHIDVIVHLAANTGVAPSVKDPRSDCMNNVLGILNYLEAARYNNVKRFIFASSGASVGECEPPLHEEIVPHPISPYGASKLAGEAYCSAYFRTFGIETVSLRFGNVYGPLSAQKNSVVAKFIKRAIEGKSLEIYGDGQQTRDFIYINDLIQAIRLAGNPIPLGSEPSTPSLFPWGEAFQIATNTETTITELIDKLIPILKESGYKNVELHYKEPRIGDLRRNFSDTAKVERMLGWSAKVELPDGLDRTVKWFVHKLV